MPGSRPCDQTREGERTDLSEQAYGFPEDLIPLLPFLPDQTARAWVLLAPVIPESAYLIGGTALTLRLHHRVSRDLDFALERHEDIPTARTRIEAEGLLAVTYQDERTLNGVFEGTKIQLLEAGDQKIVGPLTAVAGIRVASVDDVAAMKMKVIVDRGEMRDYFDLMELDRRSIVPAETALRLFLERYDPPNPDQAVVAVIRALGYLDDVEPDPALPVESREIEQYWQRRQPEVLRLTTRW